MKRFKIEQSDMEGIGQTGLALIGQAIRRYTYLKSHVDSSVARRHGITHSDVLKSYLGFFCDGKKDFEAINSIDNDVFFRSALDVDEIPSEAKLRRQVHMVILYILFHYPATCPAAINLDTVCTSLASSPFNTFSDISAAIQQGTGNAMIHALTFQIGSYLFSEVLLWGQLNFEFKHEPFCVTGGACHS